MLLFEKVTSHNESLRIANQSFNIHCHLLKAIIFVMFKKYDLTLYLYIVDYEDNQNHLHIRFLVISYNLQIRLQSTLGD